nr:MAG TPA: Cytosine specific methyltransferase [Caudoviricetes sp.]
MEQQNKKGMTLGSLFDGSGGFPLVGVLSGITPVWASEIEPFPIRVTSVRFPNMKHLGDITKIKVQRSGLLISSHLEVPVRI